jgi:hypothetical protein
MSAKKRSPLYQWEQEMIDAYYDYQWHSTLDPLYEKFQQWKAGELTHDEMDNAIHQTHKSCQSVYMLFMSKRDFLVGVIQFDENWFPRWVKDHPKPEE